MEYKKLKVRAVEFPLWGFGSGRVSDLPSRSAHTASILSAANPSRANAERCSDSNTAATSGNAGKNRDRKVLTVAGFTCHRSGSARYVSMARATSLAKRWEISTAR